MKKVFIDAEGGCDRRKIDASRISKYLNKNGYKIVFSPKEADIIIVSTCGVVNSLKEKHFEKIKNFSKYDGEVIVIGCIPGTDKKRLNNFFNGQSLSTKNISKIQSLLPADKINFSEIEDSNSIWINLNKNKVGDVIKLLFLKFYYVRIIYLSFCKQIFKILFGKNYLILQIYYDLNLPITNHWVIRISSGCLGNCSYCVIKKAVGTIKSKPLNICLNEFKKGLKRGHSNFFITAEDTGGYGLDIKSNFPQLLKMITNLKGHYYINIYALNPTWVVKYIDELELIVKKGKIKSICIPIQSGNKRILRLMKRNNDIEKIKKSINRLRNSYPDIFIATHCIVGFPSETFEEFKETLDFINTTNINLGQILKMSVNTGSVAEKIEPKISNLEIIKRMDYAKKYLKKSGYKTFKLNEIVYFKK